MDKFNHLTSLSDADLQNLSNWGFNVVRLGVMWPGVEPQENSFNLTYLTTIKELIIKMHEKYGIFTIVDVHQDLLSSAYCGEGIPDWLYQKYLQSQLNLTCDRNTLTSDAKKLEQEHHILCHNFSIFNITNKK